MDADGDGFADALAVTGRVHAQPGGELHISADLASVAGDVLASAETLTTVPGGSSSFTLSFPGKALGGVQAETIDGSVASGLHAKIDAAEASVARGSSGAAANELRAFANQVAAQRGKKIEEQTAFQMEDLALRIRARL